MVLCTAGNEVNASLHQAVSQSCSILDDLSLISTELIRKSFFKSNCLCSDDVHQRSALLAREYCGVDLLRIFFFAHDDTATRSSQCLVGGCCYEISIRNRVRVKSCSYKTCDVSHIYHKDCTNLISDLTELLEIYLSCVSRSTCNYKLWTCFLSNSKDIIIVDSSFIIYTVRNCLEILT